MKNLMNDANTLLTILSFWLKDMECKNQKVDPKVLGILIKSYMQDNNVKKKITNEDDLNHYYEYVNEELQIPDMD